jgi:hypothetical protein
VLGAGGGESAIPEPPRPAAERPWPARIRERRPSRVNKPRAGACARRTAGALMGGSGRVRVGADLAVGREGEVDEVADDRVVDAIVPLQEPGVAVPLAGQEHAGGELARERDSLVVGGGRVVRGGDDQDRDGGARAGRPKCSRMATTAGGSVTSARILRRPPHGQVSTSSRKPRRRSEAPSLRADGGGTIPMPRRVRGAVTAPRDGVEATSLGRSCSARLGAVAWCLAILHDRRAVDQAGFDRLLGHEGGVQDRY